MSTASDLEVQADTAPQLKKKKLTVAQNAVAIETLSRRVAGVDAQLVIQNSQLASIADMLTKMAPATGPQPAAPTAPNPSAAPIPSAAAPPPAAPSEASAGPQAIASGSVPTAGLDMFPTPEAQITVNPSAMPGTATGLQPAARPLPDLRRSTISVTTAPTPPPPAMGNVAFPPAPQTAFSYDFDGPEALQDLDDDDTITKRVAHALHLVANPFATSTGKRSQLAHHFVTKGQKMQRAGLGETTMGEYFWGFIQLIKSKDPNDPDLPFMNQHLEKIAEDAKTLCWEGIRAWSEDVCVKIAKKRLNWSDTYNIDRLQTNFAHQYQLRANQPAGEKFQREDRVYEIPDSVKYGKPAPPCKEYQQGKCSFSSCHVSGGYRCLHICNYCLSNKCSLMPHPLNQCKTKRFNEKVRGKAGKSSGFGSA